MTSRQADRIEIRLAGEGGQGLILAGIILAEAAAIYDGKQVVQTQTYSPEARGGPSKSEVIIADSEIDYPEALDPDVVVILNQAACDKYAVHLKPGCLLIVDSSKVKRLPSAEAVQIPISRLAIEQIGKVITANIVALGVLVGLTNIVSHQALKEAVAARSPKGTEELNRKALATGFAATRQIKTFYNGK
jgi:2-oxoglutarate ferredoxin oxidoreductase subunit gamma